jgi:sugar (pentulose or hexulose) kinase
MTTLIGIDAGTSAIKAVAFAPDGVPRAQAACETPLSRPRPGWVEQDMEETWARTGRVVAEVVAALPDGAEIAAVGVTGQGDGCWLIDKDGRPVRPAILWSDGRAADYIQEWQASGRAAQLYEICGCAPFPGSSVPLLNWLRDEEPAALERADLLFHCKDWIKYRLTGTRTIDPSDATLPLLDVETMDYSEAVPDLVGVPELQTMRPPLAAPTDVVGTVIEAAAETTGLPAGVPVVSGILDIPACAFGSGAVAPGDRSSVVGTTALNQALQGAPHTEPANVGFTIAMGDGRWTRVMASMAGTPNLDWVLDEILDTDDYDAVEARVRDVPVGADGVLYHPYLSASGERSPFLQPTARAQFTGLSPEHTRDHLARAVYEGVALAMRDCYAHMPGPAESVLMGGGGARSALWCQMFADCLGTRVDVPAGEEFGAKGAALLAGVGVGLYPDLPSAVARTARVARSYEPEPAATDKYARLYDLYRETYEAMFELWDRRAEVLADLGAMGAPAAPSEQPG